MEEGSISLFQKKLIEKALGILSMAEWKPLKTPLSMGVNLKRATLEEKELFQKLNINYCTYTGILNYLS
jgi:hypothetical protein